MNHLIEVQYTHELNLASFFWWEFTWDITSHNMLIPGAEPRSVDQDIDVTGDFLKPVLDLWERRKEL